jgi:hypothetical protein
MKVRHENTIGTFILGRREYAFFKGEGVCYWSNENLNDFFDVPLMARTNAISCEISFNALHSCQAFQSSGTANMERHISIRTKLNQNQKLRKQFSHFESWRTKLNLIRKLRDQFLKCAALSARLPNVDTFHTGSAALVSHLTQIVSTECRRSIQNPPETPSSASPIQNPRRTWACQASSPPTSPRLPWRLSLADNCFQ